MNILSPIFAVFLSEDRLQPESDNDIFLVPIGTVTLVPCDAEYSDSNRPVIPT